MLRDRVDVITDDWNQAYHYIGEAFTHAVKIYENRTGERLQWIRTPSEGEMRTIIVNWPVHADPSSKGPLSHKELMIKPIDKWGSYDAADFGLRATDTDSHSPCLYLLRKAEVAGRAAVHVRSEAGKKRDAERRTQKRREKRATP